MKSTCCFIIAIIIAVSGNAQSCESSSFGSYFHSPGFGRGPFADTIPGGGFIVGSVTNYKKSLVKSDAQGNLLWTKKYDFVGAQSYTETGCGKVDKNGNYVIDINARAIALLDPQGEVITIKELQKVNYNYLIHDVFILPNNSKLLYIEDQDFYGGEAYSLVCLSADLSTILWTKYFSDYSLYLGNPEFVDNKLYFAGRRNQDGVFLIVDALNGNLLQSGSFTLAGTTALIRGVYKYNTGYLVTALYLSAPNNQVSHAIIRTDLNFNVQNSYLISNIYNDQGLLLIPEPDGSFYGCPSGVGNRFFVSANDEFLWSKNASIGFLHKPFKFFKYHGGLASIGLGNWFNVAPGTYQTSIGIVKSDQNGIFSCDGNLDNRVKHFVNAARQPYSIFYRDSSFFWLGNVTPIVENHIIETNKNCNIQNICNALSIEGEQNICGLGSHNYIAKRNPGCALPAIWTVLGNASGFTQQKLNDSTVRLSFLQAGSYVLIGNLDGICTSLADTININVSGSAMALDLGPEDSTICPDNSIILDAGPGFSSYLWHDGSVQQTFIVTSPGMYHLTAVSACGTTFRDTITFNLAAPVPISIGQDRTKCNNDTLHLSATAGFLNYEWGNNYNISSLTGQSVIVNPAIDTFYFVKAEKSPGCFAYDTVRITTSASEPINLGKDTSICTGSSLVLNAGNGFASYSWSNGMSTAQISVNTIGTYNVVATTAQGCSSRDTISLQSLYPLPVIALDKKTGICTGESRVLNAGNHSSYLWHDGNTSSTYTVQTIGTYFVEVTDTRGCKGSDTTRINAIYPLPHSFLENAKEKCNYQSVVIVPSRNFDNYYWSTGSSTSTISISDPGIYWLQVVDTNKCSGKDTINIVEKECLTGLYVPSAFTPNGDAKNDYLKALLFGSVQFFEFNVFNRYGQLVFTTKDPSRGWDGMVKGTKQETGNFVWICRYRINNEQERIEKGISLLIR